MGEVLRGRESDGAGGAVGNDGPVSQPGLDRPELRFLLGLEGSPSPSAKLSGGAHPSVSVGE